MNGPESTNEAVFNVLNCGINSIITTKWLHMLQFFAEHH